MPTIDQPRTKFKQVPAYERSATHAQIAIDSQVTYKQYISESQVIR